MEEVHKGSSNNAGTTPSISIQASTLQAAHLSQIAQQMSLRGPTPLSVLQGSGEQVQVQGVIQTAQSSVIHPPQVQTLQVASLSETEESQDSSDSVDSSKKARGILARRPSYRKILKDLSSEDRREDDEESADSSAVSSMSGPTSIYQTSTGQYIAIAPNGALQFASPGADGMQGLQALTMTNAGGTQPGTTILQYAQTSDGQQILVPSNQVVVQTASGDLQAYQIRTTSTTTSLPQTVVMTSPVSLSSPPLKTDDPQIKREIRLMKNRFRQCHRNSSHVAAPFTGYHSRRESVRLGYADGPIISVGIHLEGQKSYYHLCQCSIGFLWWETQQSQGSSPGMPQKEERIC